jgi:hypothetical protein
MLFPTKSQGTQIVIGIPLSSEGDLNFINAYKNIPSTANNCQKSDIATFFI